MQSSRLDTTDEEVSETDVRIARARELKRRSAKSSETAGPAHRSKRTRGKKVDAKLVKRAKLAGHCSPSRTRIDTTEEEDAGSAKDTEDEGAVPGDGVRASAPSAPSAPRSSSISDNARWVVDHVLTDTARGTVCQSGIAEELRVGSMCAGMGTEEIVLTALSHAVSLHGHTLRWQSVFKAELDKKKMEFLLRHYGSTETLFVYDNAELQATHVKDARGKQRDGQPHVDILTCGIVCKDISGLNNKGKTERNAAGKSGSSLHGLLGYIKCCAFDKRPVALILECVARLGHHRQVDPDDRAGTAYIHDELLKLGYVGDWMNVDAKQFYLPQSRPRVYGLFLKMKSSSLSEACRAARLSDCKKAQGIIRRMQPQTPPESLREVLSRTPPVMHTSSRSAPSALSPSWETCLSWQKEGPRWPQAHANYVKEKGLADFAAKYYTSFAEAAAGVLQPRAAEATWLKLASMLRAGAIDIKRDVWVATAGASIDYIQVRKDMFPCVTPHMTYVICDHGRLRLANGFDALAVQGVQAVEVATHKLKSEAPPLLQDLAGNAFSAPILAAFLIAAMLVK